MLGAITQFEPELMLERQREGVVKAAEGKYKGRPHTARAQAPRIINPAFLIFRSPYLDAVAAASVHENEVHQL
jgi:DNA invertase Pin-like site-specific DNA recombinase